MAAGQLADGIKVEALHADRLRSESLLWNFTVPGDEAAQLFDELKEGFPEIPWQQPARLRNRIAISERKANSALTVGNQESDHQQHPVNRK